MAFGGGSEAGKAPSSSCCGPPVGLKPSSVLAFFIPLQLALALENLLHTARLVSYFLCGYPTATMWVLVYDSWLSTCSCGQVPNSSHVLILNFFTLRFLSAGTNYKCKTDAAVFSLVSRFGQPVEARSMLQYSTAVVSARSLKNMAIEIVIAASKNSKHNNS